MTDPISLPAQFIDTPEALNTLVDGLSSAHEFAIDTEFHRERTYFPRLALIQMAWDGGAALIDPIGLDLAPLRVLFESDARFVFHAFEQDLNILERAVGAVPHHLFDTQIAAGFLGYSRPGLATLLERSLSVTLPKADRLSDWTKRPLTSDQLRYAQADVAYLLQLSHHLIDALTSQGRLEWNEEETSIAALRRFETHDPSTAWMRIKECRNLPQEARKVAKAIAEWREEEAIRCDVPVRFILSDLAVATISQAKPRTRDALEHVRGVEARRMNSSQIEAVLDRIARALGSDEVVTLPTPPYSLPRGATSVVTLCLTWLTAKANHEQLDPVIAGTRDDVGDLLYGSGGRLGKGWRKSLFGEDMIAIRDGQAALRVNKKGALELVSLSNYDDRGSSSTRA
ncbi:MAG: ribonuclease D [Acidimicrobiales bacterium]